MRLFSQGNAALVVGSIVASAVALSPAPAQTAKKPKSEAAIDAKARAIHTRVLKVDAHVDVLLPSTPDRYFAAGRTSHADVDKLRKGDIDVIALALAVGRGSRSAGGVAEARAEADEKLAVIHGFVTANAEHVAFARSAADITRLHAEGKIAVLPSFLNARIIGGNLAAIDTFYQAGVRLFGMAHSGNNDFTDSSRPTGEPVEEHRGLSPLGAAAIDTLNRLGVIIDVSQLSTKALLQTTSLSKAPVIASHSAVRAIVDHIRNLSDEELDAIKATGGTVHINLFNGYLVPVPPEMPGKVRELRARYGLNPDFPPPFNFAFGEEVIPLPQRSKFDDELAALYPKGSVKEYVDHVEYIIKRLGIDHVGIGTDFNHGAGIEGYRDEGDALNVTRELVRRGYTEPQIAKIWGGNFMRVFREVEKVSRSLRNASRKS